MIPVRLVQGDRIRLTRPLYQAITAALKAGEDTVMVSSAVRVDTEGGGSEVQLVVSRLELPQGDRPATERLR